MMTIKINNGCFDADCYIFGYGSITYVDGIKSVSYTHLDVYKRQVRESATDPIISNAENKRKLNLGRPLIRRNLQRRTCTKEGIVPCHSSSCAMPNAKSTVTTYMTISICQQHYRHVFFPTFYWTSHISASFGYIGLPTYVQYTLTKFQSLLFYVDRFQPLP